MEDGEGEGDVEADSDETGTDSLVESEKSFVSVNTGEAVLEAFVLLGVNSLHLGLYNIHRVVKHGGAESSETTGEQVNEHLPLDVLGQGLLGVFEHDETHTLVGGLLQEGGEDTLVETAETVLLSNRVDSVEHVSELRLFGELVVNKSGLEGLLRSDNEDGLGGTSGDTTAEHAEPILAGEIVALDVGVGAESDVVLGHGEHKQRAVSTVETQATVSFNRISHDVDGTLLVEVGVKLHDGLSVLSGVGARDLNSTSDSAYKTKYDEVINEKEKNIKTASFSPRHIIASPLNSTLVFLSVLKTLCLFSLLSTCFSSVCGTCGGCWCGSSVTYR